jgi:amino acid transporter
MFGILKRILLGRPLATAEEGHQRLIKVIALAVFSSDAISSTAYATEEILHVLVPVAAEDALEYLIPISIIVMVLLTVVVASYRQVIFAYPNGGGSYVVSQDNLGETPSLVAGASLLVDYVLTVAVSVSAGVAAITSAFHGLRPYRVELCLLFIALLMIMNLRGIKESGSVFAIPTYIYILALGALLAVGLSRVFFGDLGPLTPVRERYDEFTENGVLMTGVTAYLFMRAFSSGAVALTGVEAVSNGVPSFRKPEARNAATTLVWMGLILGAYFFGISVLAHRLQPTLSEEETVLSILGGAVFGDGSVLYYVLQFATFAILILAANTAFAGFPSIASILARDGYLPHQLANRGDRLVFSNGIFALSIVAGLLVIAFGGVTTALIPLYAVGVFTGFTLSQLGMVRRHLRLREPGWQRNTVVNSVGAAATGIVLVVVIVSKFTIGAWVPVLLIPLIVLGLRSIKKHYDRVRSVVEIQPGWKPRRYEHVVVIPVSTVDKRVLNAVTFARAMAPNRIVGVKIVHDEAEHEKVMREWEEHEIPIELVTRISPYRELTTPLMEFLDELDAEDRNDIINVVIPEFVTSIGTQWLHNQSALALKARLLYRPHTVVTSVPVHVDAEQAAGVVEDQAPVADNVR